MKFSSLKEWKTRAVYFYLAVFSVIIVSRFFKMFVMLGSRLGLSSGQELICGYAAYFLAAVFTGLAVYKTADEETESPKQKISIPKLLNLLLKALTNGLALLAVLNLLGLIKVSIPVSETAGFAKYIPSMIISILQSLAVGVCLLFFAVNLLNEKQSLADRLKKTLKGLHFAAFFGGMYFIATFLYSGLAEVMVAGYGKSATVLGYMAKLLILTIPVFILLVIPFYFLVNYANKTSKAEEIKTEETPKKIGSEAVESTDVEEIKADENTTKKGAPALFKASAALQNLILGGAAAVLLIVLYLISGLTGEKAEDVAVSKANEPLVAVILNLEEGQYTEAMAAMKNAEALNLAWRAFADELNSKLESAYLQAPENPQIQLLRAVLTSEEKEIAEPVYDLLKKDPEDEVLMYSYLLAAKGAEDEDRELVKQILIKQITADNYSCSYILPGKLSAKQRQNIATRLEEMPIEEYKNGDLMICAELITKKLAVGHYSADLLNEMFAAAEQYPEYYGVQFIALSELSGYGTSIDGYGTDYRDTYYTDARPLIAKAVALAERFLELSRKMIDSEEDLDEETKKYQMAQKVLSVSQVYLNLGQYEKAYELLQKGVEEYGNEDLMIYQLIECCLEFEENEAARDYLLKLYNNGQKDVMVITDLAIVYNRLDDIENSLKYACELTKMAINDTENEKLGRMLISLVDVYIYREHRLAYFPKKTKAAEVYSPGEWDNYLDKIKDDYPLLAELIYIEYGYSKTWLLDTDERIETYRDYENRIYALIEKYPKLSTGYYLLAKFLGDTSIAKEEANKEALNQGVINLELSLGYYAEALKIDPYFESCWFDMATIYDYLGDYNRTYECALMTLCVSDGRYIKPPSTSQHDMTTTTRYKAFELIDACEKYFEKEEQE